MDKQEQHIDTLIDDNGNFYACGEFADGMNNDIVRFQLCSPLSHFVKQNKKDIIQIGQSNLSVFLVDKNHDLWIVGYFKYFPYIRKNIRISKKQKNSNQYHNGLVTRPFKIKLGFPVADVATFSTWVFLLDTEGNIWKSGSNVYPDADFCYDCPKGEVLNKGFDDLIKISSDPIFRSISCGKYHLIAIDHSGNLWSYEDIIGQKFDFGQSGFFRQHTRRLTQVTKDIQFNNVVCGKYSTCALDNHGCLYACGLCSYFTGRDVRKQNLILPVDIDYCNWHSVYDVYDDDDDDDDDVGCYYDTYYLPHLTKIESDIRFMYLSIGNNRSLFVDIDGKLWGYGYNSLLGLNEPSERTNVLLTPIDLKEDVKFKSVWCQNDSSYALSDDGIIFGCRGFSFPRNIFTRDVGVCGFHVGDSHEETKMELLTDYKILMLPNEKLKPKGLNTKSARNKA